MGKFFFRLGTGLHAKLFKLTGGKFFGGGTDDGSVLVLTHKGAKSGKVRDTPLMFFRRDDAYLLVASAGGADEHPGWYHNLMANPDTIVNINGEEVAVTAHSAGEQRDAMWADIVAAEARFEKYESTTDRIIPVVVMEPN